MRLYVNPKLSRYDYGVVRFGGAGLANCLFVAGRAAILAKNHKAALLRPTWERLGIGQWLRREKDKRFYTKLFAGNRIKEGLRKLWVVSTHRKYGESVNPVPKDGVVVVQGLGDYFDAFRNDVEFVRAYILGSVCPSAVSTVPMNMKNSVAVHVRLGDYVPERRVPIKWYKSVIERLLAVNSCRNIDIQLFSDGRDEELTELLSLPGVHRVCYGNALADIIAISRCGLLIGSDSTFSGWGAFLGNVPCVFARVHYGKPLADESRMCIAEDASAIPETFFTYF